MDRMDKARRVLTTASSAFAALVMVGAIAFGSTVIRPMTASHEPQASAAQTDDGGTATKPVAFDKSDGDYHDHWKPEPKEEPKDEATEAPKEEPKAEQPKQEPKEEPKPNPAPSSNLSLAAGYNAEKGKLVVEWTAFTGYFEKYKLVRSSDAAVSWPEGPGDTLVGVIGAGDTTRFVDYDAPCATELHYRVFAVKHGGEGYVVLASSNVDGASRPCPPPPPDPVALTFEVGQVAEGVQLSWQACTSDAFAVYKVVRSATNPDPRYPLNDGTELIGVIGDAGVTGFTDSNVEAGQTWTYRVLCMGQNGDGWYVIGLTPAVSVAVE